MQLVVHTVAQPVDYRLQMKPIQSVILVVLQNSTKKKSAKKTNTKKKSAKKTPTDVSFYMLFMICIFLYIQQDSTDKVVHCS